MAAIERSQWVIEHYPQTPQVPEALATMAYGYDKLGDKETSQQYISVLKQNYPNLVKSNGEVNIRAARKEASWWNRATLGILGRGDKAEVSKDASSETSDQAAQKSSLLNKVSFGLLDRPNREVSKEPARADESLYDGQRK
ncbi:Outer membrane protein assembly factor BamD [compost metagenome]